MLRTVTSTSLLEGLRDPGNDELWEQYVGRYRPLLLGYARRLGFDEHECEDLAQAALLSFVTAYRDGKYDRERGRLRSWLFGIAHNHVRNFRRRREREPRPGSGDSQGPGVEELAWSDDELEQRWEEEWRRAVLGACLDEIRREVQPATLRAFERFAVEGRPAREVAGELDMSENAVFGARRRILRRVRELLPLMEDIW